MNLSITSILRRKSIIPATFFLFASILFSSVALAYVIDVDVSEDGSVKIDLRIPGVLPFSVKPGETKEFESPGDDHNLGTKKDNDKFRVIVSDDGKTVTIIVEEDGHSNISFESSDGEIVEMQSGDTKVFTIDLLNPDFTGEQPIPPPDPEQVESPV